MENLLKKKEELKKQFREYNNEFHTITDIENYKQNQKLEREIKKIEIKINMDDKELMSPIKSLTEKLMIPCAIVEHEVCVEINGGILKVIEEDVNEHKYLFFMSKDQDLFYYEENYQKVIEKILFFYIKKTKEEKRKTLILNYENLNNMYVDIDLEELGFERFEQEGEGYEGDLQFLKEAPELFFRHLPRGLYILEFNSEKIV